MAYRTYRIPNFPGTQEDLVFLDPSQPDATGTLHYSFAISADRDAKKRRMFEWKALRPFHLPQYQEKHAAHLERIQRAQPYVPGESYRNASERGEAEANATAVRLGALEVVANIASGRLSTGDKDPFRHQLALQQEVKRRLATSGTAVKSTERLIRRVLIADEVGLGKTIEAGLIVRDVLLAQGRIDKLSCLYLTSGGLTDDAAKKLGDVLRGAIDNVSVVDVIPSFKRYGNGGYFGVKVGSMHAARNYVTQKSKAKLEPGVSPDIVIIDECHHCASEENLSGKNLEALSKSATTRSYEAALQIITGKYWPDSKPPSLVILMSATPFRSESQFTNLLRLLTHGIATRTGDKFNAFASGVGAEILQRTLESERESVIVAWRRQTDEEVRSWNGNRKLFPDLTVLRAADSEQCKPTLQQPSQRFLDLIKEIKACVKATAKAHGSNFGSLSRHQLEKKLTSSSVAGACWIFSWIVRHQSWATQDEFKKDERESTEGIRQLLREISRSLAGFNELLRGKHADVAFPSDGFEFSGRSLAQGGKIVDIQKYSEQLNKRDVEDGSWIMSASEVKQLTSLAIEFLKLGGTDEHNAAAESSKLHWLKEMLTTYPEDRFIVFTESLQTCEIVSTALGDRCVMIRGSMSTAERNRAIAKLADPNAEARVLIATSAADEGLDLQVANRVVHWDLSPNPAVLMQRNGRVARLGQVNDVVAYYLILAETHEEQRDRALLERFASLGITDENMRIRVLGTLSEEEERTLDDAIEREESQVVERILQKAKAENEDMARRLEEINSNLRASHALSREDLEERLRIWKSIGLPDDTDCVDYNLATLDWRRPIFESPMRIEEASSTSAHFHHEKDPSLKCDVVFDPECLLFGDVDGCYRLAGLSPWMLKPSDSKIRIESHTGKDLLGRLVRSLVRLPGADFCAIDRALLLKSGILEQCPGARWVLFCTHPLREEEEDSNIPYLTYYVFDDDGSCDGNAAGAEDVQAFILDLEKAAASNLLQSATDAVSAEEIDRGGELTARWVETQTAYGQSGGWFSREPSKPSFVPIPVALIAIVPD